MTETFLFPPLPVLLALAFLAAGLAWVWVYGDYDPYIYPRDDLL
jgi:hypothetical protein